MTAYMLWLQDNRSRIKEENPGISVIEISKKAGPMWKEASTSEKKVNMCRVNIVTYSQFTIKQSY